MQNIKFVAHFEQMVVKAGSPSKLVLILEGGNEDIAPALKALQDEDFTVEITPIDAPLPF